MTKPQPLLLAIMVLLAVLQMPYPMQAASHKYKNDVEGKNPTRKDTIVSIPLGGNAFVTSRKQGAGISDAGLTDWTDAASVISIYFKVAHPGTADLYLRLKAPDGKSKLSIKVAGQAFSVTASGAMYDTVKVGKVKFEKPGYVKVDIQGLRKTGNSFGQISDLILAGAPVTNHLAFVKDNGSNRFHFGRRGPSVHLNYPQPGDFAKNTEWFYNEVEVPKGEDVIGSYFQVNGFAFGYFGIQVNSETERRILFSVWSPFNTDDPKSIPDSLRIRLLKKGEGVYTGEFGNEGSGGQSYLKYNWKAGTRYAFLLRAQPSPAANTTVFTAYFKNPGTGHWQLIASFQRPQTNSGLTRLYSFLENFIPEAGYKERHVYFTNQWLRSFDGRWQPVTTATFTADDIARRGQRLDYDGGVKGAFFYLRNCGFFDDNRKIGTTLTREPDMTSPPAIDFETLP
ncbi:DUF3472 domain-containing protein [Pontibacter sp. 172403-2]|uniref:DUF3472 domain-containing protein n=1 Tax=Pontibacter rufus TaxID=2791028 RepID=UPI0018AF5DB3|nr:DUF3472 domain-containing protein [Pontibacter sp. 172403-2]MBF9252707.1 DUF3472 domain-containing protein [Pontibacter sp. 172403-2]